MVKWDAKKITNWSAETFGNPDFHATAKRMKKEIDEFYEAIEKGDLENAIEEMVDIEVMLRQCAHLSGIDLDEGVDSKMEINQKRVWARTEDGDFQHV